MAESRKQVTRRNLPQRRAIASVRDWDMNVVLSGVQFAQMQMLGAVLAASLALLGLWVLWTLNQSFTAARKIPQPLLLRIRTAVRASRATGREQGQLTGPITPLPIGAWFSGALPLLDPPPFARTPPPPVPNDRPDLR